MTIVEIYDTEVIDNIIASSKFNNDKIIYIGYDKKNMEHGVENIRKYFDMIGRKIDISCIYVCRNNLKCILEEIINFIEKSKNTDEFIFDVSGGDDLILVAMGIIAERYKIDMFTTSHKGKVVWQTENNIDYEVGKKKSAISVRENIILHGGEIVGPNNKGGVYPKWEFSDEYVVDLLNMWEICRKDCVRWNREIGEIQQAINKNNQLINGIINKTMQQLIDIGVLTKEDSIKSDVFGFKNVQIKESLMKVGNVLELYTCIVARQLNNSDGSRLFQDVRVGVYIDWDGIIHDVHDKEKDTRNEIDVMMMKGVVPVFVSCKNGEVGIDELYKLNTVAEKFGGKYAKKVLIMTYFGKKGASYEYFMQRAKDMKITIMSDVHKMTRENFEKLLCNI